MIVRGFEAPPPEALPFYEAPWFAMLARSGAALIAVLLVLLLGVRPLIKAFRPAPAPDPIDEATATPGTVALDADVLAAPTLDPATGRADAELLRRKVGIAQRLAADKPDGAAAALRQMLAEPAA